MPVHDIDLEKRKDFLKGRPHHEVKAINTLFNILTEAIEPNSLRSEA